MPVSAIPVCWNTGGPQTERADFISFLVKDTHLHLPFKCRAVMMLRHRSQAYFKRRYISTFWGLYISQPHVRYST